MHFDSTRRQFLTEDPCEICDLCWVERELAVCLSPRWPISCLVRELPSHYRLGDQARKSVPHRSLVQETLLRMIWSLGELEERDRILVPICCGELTVCFGWFYRPTRMVVGFRGMI